MGDQAMDWSAVLLPAVMAIVAIFSLFVAWRSQKYAKTSAEAAKESARASHTSALTAREVSLSALLPGVEFGLEKSNKDGKDQLELVVFLLPGRPTGVLTQVKFQDDKPILGMVMSLVFGIRLPIRIPEQLIMAVRAKPRGQRQLLGAASVSDETGFSWDFDFCCDLDSMTVKKKEPRPLGPMSSPASPGGAT
jgi:hypothetical protein